jgi:hypothetical protein
LIDDGNDVNGAVGTSSLSTAAAVRRKLASRAVVEIGVIMVATPQDNTAPAADGSGQSVFEKSCIDAVTTDVGLAVTSGAMQQSFLQQSVILATALGESASAIVENVVFMPVSPVVLNLTPTRQPTAAPLTELAAKNNHVGAIVGGIVAALACCAIVCVKMSRSSFPVSDEDADANGSGEPSIKHADEENATATAAVVLKKSSVLPMPVLVAVPPNQIAFPVSDAAYEASAVVVEDQRAFPDL